VLYIFEDDDMKKIRLLSWMFLVIPNLCFAGLVTVNIDFWDSAPYVFDGHMVLGGNTDSSGKLLGISEGTIAFGGNTYDFSPTSFSFTDYSTSSNWDWIISNIQGDYIDSSGVAKTAWAHLEGLTTTFYSEGMLGLTGDSFVYTDTSLPRYNVAHLTVVSAPEPASFVLLLLGFMILGLGRWYKLRV
jgi:hypothetical protein